MVTLAEIYNWFMTGKKPTQAQFWASWGSFWHKEESIPQSSVNNLVTTLNAKAEKDQFDSHKTDPNAHAALFAKVRIIGLGEFIVFKRGTETPDELEPTDLIIGIVENAFITGIYQGGDILLDNFNIINQIDF